MILAVSLWVNNTKLVDTTYLRVPQIEILDLIG